MEDNNNEISKVRQRRIVELEAEAAVQKKIAEAIKVSETRYRRLFETAKDGILILGADTGQIDDVNPFLTNLLGYAREELLGKELWEIGPLKDIAASKTAFDELQKKEYVRYEHLPLESKDGRPLDVEFVSNVYLVDHKKVIQCNIRDITERRRAEEGIARLGAIVESSDDAIASVTLDGVIVSWNATAERIFCYSAEEAKGRPISLLIPPDRPNELPQILERVREGERIDHYETVRMRKDGSLIDVSLTISPIKDKRGSIIGISEILRDITKNKLAEAERENLIVELREALSKIKTLKGLIPICAWCKKIRDDKGYWTKVETYIREHSDASFTHGMCPECLKKESPETYDEVFKTRTEDKEKGNERKTV